jgi:hypothetical protein
MLGPRVQFNAPPSPLAGDPTLIGGDGVSPEGVIPQYLAFAFHRHPWKVYEVLLGPKVLSTLRVSEVGGADDDVVADGVDQILDAWIVLVRRHETLTLEVFHRRLVESLYLEPPGASLDAGFQAVGPESGPSAPGFQENQFQLGMPLQHPAHDEGGARQHAAHDKGNSGSAIPQAGQIIEQSRVEGVTGAGMEPYRYAELGAGLPQNIAFLIVEAKARNWRWVQMPPVHPLANEVSQGP